MKIVVYVIVGLIGLVLLSLVWRFASQRHSLPCPTWLGWMVEMDNPFTKVNRAATIIQHLKLEPGMSVVDVGCGPGRLTIPLAQKIGPSGTLVALDIQAGMLERVQKKVGKAGLTNVTLLEAGIGQNALKRNTFDRALMVAVLGEIPEQEAALQEVFGALKPGGILSITEIIFDPHFQRRSTVQKLAEKAGFKSDGFYGSWYAYTLHVKKPNEETHSNET